MDKEEARQLLAAQLATYRTRPYADLVAMIGQDDCVEISGPSGQLYQLELGVHEQWSEAANVPGQYWSGFRIIDIGPDDYNVLYDWVMSPGGQLV